MLSSLTSALQRPILSYILRNKIISATSSIKRPYFISAVTRSENKNDALEFDNITVGVSRSKTSPSQQQSNPESSKPIDESFPELLDRLSGSTTSPSDSAVEASSSAVHASDILPDLSEAALRKVPPFGKTSDEVTAAFKSAFTRNTSRVRKSAAKAAKDSTRQFELNPKEEAEFEAFMSALGKRSSQKSEQSKLHQKPKQIPEFITNEFGVKVPTTPKDMSNNTFEEAQKIALDHLNQLNKDGQKLDSSNIFLPRAEQPGQPQVSSWEKEQLDDATEQILNNNGKKLPPWVINVDKPQPDGKIIKDHVLNRYEDPLLTDLTKLAEETNATFESAVDSAKSVADMEYWPLFPLSVKRWLIYTRTPKGYYNDYGEWVVLPESALTESRAIQNEDLQEEGLEQPEQTIQEQMDDIDPFGDNDTDPDAVHLREIKANQTSEEDIQATEIINSNEIQEAKSDVDGEFDAELPEENVEFTEQEAALIADMESEGLSQNSIKEFKSLVRELYRGTLPGGNNLKPTTQAKRMPSNGQDSTSAKEEWDYWESVYQQEQKYVSPSLQGQYRFKIKPEEIEHLHPKIRRLFSFKNATDREIRTLRSSQHVEKWGKHFADTGSSSVQIAVLTDRINYLVKRLAKSPTDSHNGYRLQIMVRKRKGLMRHLKKKDMETYYKLIQEVGLRDQVEFWTSSRK